MGKSAREVIADQLAISVPNPGRYAGDNPVAAEILASLAAAGFNPPSLAATHAVVPREPTQRMCLAGYYAATVREEAVPIIYRAMLAAQAPREPEDANG